MSYTTEEGEVCTSYYSGRVGSGVIILGHDGKAMVIESADNALSKITQGMKNKELIARCKGDLKALVQAAFICHLKDTGKLCQDCDGLRTISNYVIDSTCLSFGLDSSLVPTHFFENLVGDSLSKAFRDGGLRELKTVAKVIEIAQTKNKPLPTEEEEAFLSAVKVATEAAGCAPPQRAVFDVWYDLNLRTSYDTFRGIRDRLGFSWLPTSETRKEVYRG